jgi:CMP-N-acetylneuraminic acid synthetase
MNASVYVWRRNSLISEKKVFFDTTRIYVMPTERSFDIDSELDFKIVKLLMSERRK